MATSTKREVLLSIAQLQATWLYDITPHLIQKPVLKNSLQVPRDQDRARVRLQTRDQQ